MRPSVFVSRVGLAVAVTLAAAACTEVTDLVDVVEVRVAHAAPGLPAQTLRVNGQPFTQLQVGAHVFFPAQDLPTTYAFVSAEGVVERAVVYEENINAIVLLNADAPAIHYFALERAFGDVRLAVINGDFSTTEPLIVRIVGGAIEFEEAIHPGDHFILEPGDGAFDVWVRAAGETEFQELRPFALTEVDHGFLILLRDPEPDSAFDWMLF
jgi:hypothetical protein